MKKKVVITILIFVALAGIASVLYLRNRPKDYFIIGSDINCGDNCFTMCDLKYSATELEKKLGSTDQNQDVYKIADLDENEWICVINNGVEHIYRNINIHFNSDKDLNYNKFSIENVDYLDNKKYYDNEDIIDNIFKDVTEDRVVSENIVVSLHYRITFYSAKYKGLCGSYIYMKDDIENTYLYDEVTGTMWLLRKNYLEV